MRSQFFCWSFSPVDSGCWRCPACSSVRVVLVTALKKHVSISRSEKRIFGGQVNGGLKTLHHRFIDSCFLLILYCRGDSNEWPAD